MDNGSNPFAVCNQDIDIKLGFRRKLLGLLLLNLLTVLGLMFVITCTPAIFNSVKDKSWVAGVAFFVCVYSLIMMYIVKEKYPWNYISLFIFTISLAATLGCLQKGLVQRQHDQEPPQVAVEGTFLFSAGPMHTWRATCMSREVIALTSSLELLHN